jgi:hypothetical protein
MTQNAFEFSISLEKLAKELTDEMMLKVTKKLSLQALRGVVMKSPVDTGRFRGNWNVTVGQADWTTNVEQYDKNGPATIAKGEAVIDKIPPYRIIWIANGLPYARALETGWSKQAPLGLVAITAAEIQSSLG